MSVFPPVLADAQQALIDIVWIGYRQALQWPFFEFVEGMMDKQNLDAVEVLASLPTLGRTAQGHAAYGLVRPVYSGGKAPMANQPLPLTVAGLRYVPEASNGIALFFRLLDVMAAMRREAVFNPAKLSPVLVTETALKEKLTPNPEDLAFLDLITQTEPPTWLGSSVPDARWSRQVTREIRHFEGVTSIPEYVARLALYLEEPAPAPEPRYASPFELNAALDYFNAVWKLRFDRKRPILRIFSAERTAKIALDAGTQEEFDSRLTALSEIIKNLDVPPTPGVGGHPLQRLPFYMKANLPGASGERIERAVAVLGAIRVLRDSGQHVDAMTDSAEVLPLLGLTFPITDWSGAWNTVSAAAVDAVNTLREEITVSDDDEDVPDQS